MPQDHILKRLGSWREDPTENCPPHIKKKKNSEENLKTVISIDVFELLLLESSERKRKEMGEHFVL